MKKTMKRWLAAFLCLTLFICESSLTVSAAERKASEELTPASWYNYLSYASFEEAEAGAVDVNADREETDGEFEVESKNVDTPMFSDPNLAGEYLKKAIKERRTEVSLNIHTDSVDAANKMIHTLLDIAFRETADPFEGDYLRWHMANWDCTGTRNRGTGIATMNYVFKYQSTEAQERKVRAKIDSLLSGYFKGYEKHTDAYNINRAYEWVLARFSYDHSMRTFSAYGGIIGGSTVCQGYATTIYALCKSMGVGCRLVTSDGQPYGHGWNIVEVYGKYYNLDATWGDHEYESVRKARRSKYFLTTNARVKADDRDGEHVREPEYCTVSFNKKYPMSSKNYTYTASKEKKTTAVKTIGVKYTTQVQNVGWQPWKKNGVVSGTVGQGLRMETLKAELTNISGLSLGLQYKSHIQGIGWESAWRANGAESGTSGQGRRLEAIRIRLNGADAAKYDVYYRVHAQQYGWLDWAKNGAVAGTSGQSLRLEGIQIVIKKKTQSGPGATLQGATSNAAGCAYVEYGKSAEENSAVTGLVNYQTQVQSYGWQGYVSDGAISGTMGEGKRMETIKINLGYTGYAGGISYNTHIQGIGWQGWRSNNDISGTVGQGRRIEAIEIKLTGAVSKKYDVYYSTQVEGYGWLGWAKNGKPSGTAGQGKRLEAIRIVLVQKGKAAPKGNGMIPYVQ